MDKIAIVGAGSLGKECLQLMRDCNRLSKDPMWDIVGFVDDTEALQGKVIDDCPVVGKIDWLLQHKVVGCVVGIGDPIGRKRTVERLSGVTFHTLIHPLAHISRYVTIGKGCIIFDGSIVSVHAVIGRHVVVNFNCTISHDAVVGDYCTVGPGVQVTGCVHIGTGTYLGAGSTVIDHTSVGEWVIVGAGAVVVNNVLDDLTVVGVPARMVR